MDRLNTSLLKEMYFRVVVILQFTDKALSGVLALESIDLPEKCCRFWDFLPFCKWRNS